MTRSWVSIVALFAVAGRAAAAPPIAPVPAASGRQAATDTTAPHPAAGPLRLEWSKKFLTIAAPPEDPDRIPGGPIKIHYLEAYCRPGSTDRVWGETVIPHQSTLVASDDQGRNLHIRDLLADGVVVDHHIRAGSDEVDFRISAHNPGTKPSRAHWAQPCLRVDRFTGCDPRDARQVMPPYIKQCFLLIDGRVQRLPTRPWATEARYVPGQVYCPASVDRGDVNPRPLSELAPSGPLCGCYSADGKQILAVAFEPYQEIFQGVITCFHNDFRIGGLKPGETKKIHGKLYIVPADLKSLIRRFRADFPASSAK